MKEGEEMRMGDELRKWSEGRLRGKLAKLEEKWKREEEEAERERREREMKWHVEWGMMGTEGKGRVI